jgi:hypothetical protein
MASSTYNSQELEVRRQLLREELAALESEKMKNLGGMQIVDFHHPERSPGWPMYNVNDPRNAWPRLLYHPTEKDERIEAQRLGIRRRNEFNPNLAPMDIPPSEPLTLKVANAEEAREAFARGFVTDPPQRQTIDGNSPLEVIGRSAHNPLTENPTSGNAAPTLSVETIIKLNQMPKDELVKHALEVYGVSAPEEASKVDIITAIQNCA